MQYENVQFLYNELDALGVVAGMVSRVAPEQYDSVTLVILRKGIASNYLVPYALAVVPQNSTSLERSYYNRDRLHGAYIISHLGRMRDAWQRFGQKDKK